MNPIYLYKLRILKLTHDINSAVERFDPDAIHDVRVSIRRMVTLCSILEASGQAPYSKKELQILKKKFRRAGALRDIQVQLHLLNEWENRLQDRFELYENHLRRREKILQQYFKRAFLTINLKKTLPDSVGRLLFRHHIEKELQRLDDDFRKKSLDVRSLHPLRITAKKLKYTLEIQQACYPGFGPTELFRKHLANVQDLLGSWHDVEMGLHHLTYFMKRQKIKTDDQYDSLLILMKREKEMLLLDTQLELKNQIPMKELLSVVLT